MLRPHTKCGRRNSPYRLQSCERPEPLELQPRIQARAVSIDLPAARIGADALETVDEGVVQPAIGPEIDPPSGAQADPRVFLQGPHAAARVGNREPQTRSEPQVATLVTTGISSSTQIWFVALVRDVASRVCRRDSFGQTKLEKFRHGRRADCGILGENGECDRISRERAFLSRAIFASWASPFLSFGRRVFQPSGRQRMSRWFFETSMPMIDLSRAV